MYHFTDSKMALPPESHMGAQKESMSPCWKCRSIGTVSRRVNGIHPSAPGLVLGILQESGKQRDGVETL